MLRRLLLPVLVAGACGPAVKHPAGKPEVEAAGAWKSILSEDDYNAARPEYDALLPSAPDRAGRRAPLLAYLMKQTRGSIDRGQSEEAYETFKQALTLFDAEELWRKVPSEDALTDGAARIEQAFKKRGAHEPVLVALAVEMTQGRNDERARAQHRYQEVVGWLRAGGAIESDQGIPVDGLSRVIDDLETVARLWPTPFVVAELDRLYFDRHQTGNNNDANDPFGLGRRPRRGGDLRSMLQGAAHAPTAYDLSRLYLRVSRPELAVAALQKLKQPHAGDEQIRALVNRYAGPKAVPDDAINAAKLFAQGTSDLDVAERICTDSARRFMQSPEPHRCAGQIAMMRERPGVAMRELEAARQLEPTNRDVWQDLARLWERRLFALGADENLNVNALEPMLKKVEAFHAEAQKQFGAPLRPSLASAIFEVGQGYFNAGRLPQAMAYFERSVTLEASATALERMGQIKLKKGDLKGAVSLFERGIALPKPERAEETFWRAKLSRDLSDAFEAMGDAHATERARKTAVADWDSLIALGLEPQLRAEATVERAKILYLLGERDEALSGFESAIDMAPDRGSTYADVIAFLVPRGELDEALDAYHRALGRPEVTEYLKVYCSLWIVDLARRAKQPIDPLASSYLQSTDGGKWYDDLARWATGRETEQQMLARVDTPAKRAESAYYRAMRVLEAGDLDGAKQLWREVLDTDMMAFFEYDMAQTFLRLGNAPAHPVLRSKGSRKAPPVEHPPPGSI
jgi:tetratricopeptide (TPR) repeat protein